MANYTDSNIQFNNVKEYTTFVNGNIGVKGAQGVDPEFGGIINAIDIDWNDAILDNVNLNTLKNNNTISTTGQLLSLVNNIQEQINEVTTLLINMQEQITESTAAVTKMQEKVEETMVWE